MSDRPMAVFGIYSSFDEADRAVYELLTRASLIVEVSALSAAGTVAVSPDPDFDATVARGASRGGLIGAATGALLGWLASARVIWIPWFAALTGAGPVVAVLADAVMGAMVGALVGAVVAGTRYGTPTPQPASSRGVQLAVHCGTYLDVERAVSVLQETGAAGIVQRPEMDDDKIPDLSAVTRYQS